MRLSDLELFLVEVPLAGAAEPARALVARLETEGGHEGWGEAPCRWRASELEPRRQMLLSVLAGRNTFQTEEWGDLHDGPPLAAALEMASWDLIARRAELPQCHLWGGRYRGRIPLAARVARREIESAGSVARELAEQGFHTQILTGTGTLERDVELARAVGEAVGDGVELWLDGGQNYGPAEAAQLCGELEGLRIKRLLDPLAASRWDQIASLARRTNLTLAVSAGAGGPDDVLALVRAGAAPALVVDPRQVGGASRARRCAAVAEAARLPTALGGEWALGLATAAMAHLAAATPSLDGAHPSTYHLLQDDILAEPLELADGLLAVPEGAGLGVEVDREKLEKYRAR